MSNIPLATQFMFLRQLMRWDGVASPSDLGPQTSQLDNSVRQACKRKGWVTFKRSDGYWRITDKGREAIKETAA